MKLSDYQTPLTDAARYEEPLTTCNVVGAEFARDLERKLAMCRDIIDACVNGYEKAGMPNATKAIRSLYEQTK